MAPGYDAGDNDVGKCTMGILITGATGFLGGHLASTLTKQGHTVRALVRATSRTEKLDALGVEVFVGDLLTGQGLAAAFEGATAVVHCAGGGKLTSLQDLQRNNVDTTANLLAAAKGRDLKRFVLISSLAAHGPAPDGVPRDPEAPGRPVSAYGRSKLDAEKLVLDVASEMPVTLFRPPAVYGPGDTRMLGLFRIVAKGIIPDMGGGRSTSVVYVQDCVDAIVASLQANHPSGSALFVEDGQRYLWTELGEHIRAGLGVKARRVRVPLTMLTLAATMGELYGKARNQPVALTRDKLRDMSQPHWLCDASKTRDALGWAPKTSFAEGARLTARWYLEEGWVKARRKRSD